jgi:hypothetical protein
VCLPGHWRGCIKDAAGAGPSGASVYLDNSGLACTIDYASPCRACEPDDICFNETLLHCPQHSQSPRGSDDDRDCVCDPGYAGLYGAENDA